MKNTQKLFLALVLSVFILAGVYNSPLWARGGGGCLVEGTAVDTPNGQILIENIKTGDVVFGWDGEKTVSVKVLEIIKVKTGKYIEITTAQGSVKTTQEHPFFISKSEIKTAKNIIIKDKLLRVSGNTVLSVPISEIKEKKENCYAYNLIVESPATFLINDFVVHNKGCFLPDTEILLADGEKKDINQVKAGDKLLAFTIDERIISAPVREIITAECSEYYEIVTDKTFIKVTAEHPLYTGNKTFRLAKSVDIGDGIYLFDGKRLNKEGIKSIRLVKASCIVYNLRTDYPNTFFANSVAVHNKGCFLADTKILINDGKEAAIQDIKRGGRVLAFDETGKIVKSKVSNIFSLNSPEYYEITIGQSVIRVTPEHPFLTAENNFKPINELSEGDSVFLFKDNKLVKDVVSKKKLIQSDVVVYNMQTEHPNTFFANKVAVHNKGGGCFPAGTKIITPDGFKLIDAIKTGDTVLGVDSSNKAISVKVKKVYSTISELIEIKTEKGDIRTTAEHPFLKSNGEFILAGAFKTSDLLTGFYDNRIQSDRILSVAKINGLAPVYNIEVESPHTFIANNFIVHNKGGFGGGGYRSGGRGGSGRSGGSGDDGAAFAIILGCVILGFIIVSINDKVKKSDEDLDYCYPVKKVQKKAERTKKLIDFISKNDQLMLHDLLKKTANDTFLKLQKCWQSRDYTEMKPLMVHDLYQEHLQQISSMIRNHEINVMENLKVDFAEIVRVRYYDKKEKREFTALIQARMRDYYIDDRTKEFIRGDDETAKFQEFWTFQYDGKTWILRQIEQPKESDVLTEKNFVEMFTPQQMKQIYGEVESKDSGPVGPWVETEVKTRDDRIHRHLNFLVQTDKIWDENEMKETVRNIFIAYHVAREMGGLENINNFLLAGVFESLRKTVDMWKSKGDSIEFRNLCVRRVDIVLLRNFSDNTKDEFTARVTAHAQKVIKHEGNVIKQDEYVTPFEQYWVFGRKDNKWLLKEILPPVVSLSDKSNIDEDASKDQMEWYYTKDRAI